MNPAALTLILVVFYPTAGKEIKFALVILLKVYSYHRYTLIYPSATAAYYKCVIYQMPVIL